MPGTRAFTCCAMARWLARTNDHSVVQHWVESGLISAEEARLHPQRNQITNCIGGIEDMF